ncbi:hypothetical protein [Polyangium jinanense]|uniref:Tryptophan synthase alpha chain n=1 Tax=Polyangium jinanense TaxID=2829994 RepID=A0A9X4AUP3_9BACT|nr:hypothetical protein [Polyangium jinanense]MDC3962278.1 hypothetical protein [Polyangium jinanense]MDC3962549.1 hypothetical protein [Polyangium jinanense]MDC3985459.1 hypothetical protein [Polyangium jinanense]
MTFAKSRHRVFPWLALAALAVPAAAFASACSGTATQPAPEDTCTPDLASIQETVFARACSQAGCHASVEPAGFLDLVSPGLEQRLVGAPSKTCENKLLVTPGNPDASFLIEKLRLAMPGCGLRMPPTGALPADEVACVESWIAGLPEGGGGPDAGPDGEADSGTDAPSCETCGGANCVDLATDASHCGICGHACGAGEVCNAGTCAATCGMLDVCGASCVDTQTDPNNCGACGHACATGQTCAGGTCTCGSGSVSFANDVQPLFTANCASAGCHKGVNAQEGLDLSAGKAYAELVDVAASQCNDGRKLVLPGDPAQSYLIDKMMNVELCSGTKMPKLGLLPSPQVTTVANWICAGAPNN